MRKLRRIRAEKGLTMDALEERTGVSKRTISEIERGMRAPQAITLAKIASALGVDIDELSEEEAPKVRAPLPSEESPELRRSEEPVDYRKLYLELGRRQFDLVHEVLAEISEVLTTEDYEEFVKLPVDEQHSRIEMAERLNDLAREILKTIEEEEAELAGEQRDELAQRREALASTIETFRKTA